LTVTNIQGLQDSAVASKIVRSYIIVKVTSTNLEFTIDYLDIFRWERALIKKDIKYTMTNRKTNTIVGEHTGTRTMTVAPTFIAEQ